MSASRYPLAMGRPSATEYVNEIGRFSTPTMGILANGVDDLTIVFAEISMVAKLGSAFQLVIFGLINLCVIVMRDFTYYHPVFRYPCTHGFRLPESLFPSGHL